MNSLFGTEGTEGVHLLRHYYEELSIIKYSTGEALIIGDPYLFIVEAVSPSREEALQI
jgi:hypothetical protein